MSHVLKNICALGTTFYIMNMHLVLVHPHHKPHHLGVRRLPRAGFVDNIQLFQSRVYPPGVRRDDEVGVAEVLLPDPLQELPDPCLLLGNGFSMVGLPQLVSLCDPGVVDPRERLLELVPRQPLIAGEKAKGFPRHLVGDRLFIREGGVVLHRVRSPIVGEVEADPCSPNSPPQRTSEQMLDLEAEPRRHAEPLRQLLALPDSGRVQVGVDVLLLQAFVFEPLLLVVDVALGLVVVPLRVPEEVEDLHVVPLRPHRVHLLVELPEAWEDQAKLRVLRGRGEEAVALRSVRLVLEESWDGGEARGEDAPRQPPHPVARHRDPEDEERRLRQKAVAVRGVRRRHFLAVSPLPERGRG
mmetsp:Transcript_28174/g.68528  ORF Transcript_28174/g.68528 Transcript_28174/m.68528 type:complete len:355 (+) Transcript_28174:16-1080(+)